MPHAMDDIKEDTFFKEETILLTGATGGLGGCLLYKLVVTLHAKKVFVLIRSGVPKAMESWQSSMHEHLNAILRPRSIVFAQGDMTVPGYGFSAGLRRQLEAEVTIVIHAAADISLKADLRTSIRNNTLPCIELAKMAGRFENLAKFVHVSTAYANSFLPDGPVEEKVYPIPDASSLLVDIMEGRCGDWSAYPWPYARAKHLTECILQNDYPSLPLLIVRPSSIGPAIAKPFELYGPRQSIPLDNFFVRIMSTMEESIVLPAAGNSASGENILDEVPVDLVANLLLQHVMIDTRGVVHACSRSYISKSFNDILFEMKQSVPTDSPLALAKVLFTKDPRESLSHIARFYAITHRNWAFSNSKSTALKRCGSLSMDPQQHDVQHFTTKRTRRLLGDISLKPRVKAPKSCL